MVHHAAESLKKVHAELSPCVLWTEERFLPGTTLQGSLYVPCTNQPMP